MVRCATKNPLVTSAVHLLEHSTFHAQFYPIPARAGCYVLNRMLWRRHLAYSPA